MLLTIEKVIILKSVPIFSKVPETELIELASIIKEIDVKSGENIMENGEMGSSIYIIVNGKVRVHDGNKEISILNDRNFFGELSALDPQPRSATVTAIEDTTIFRIDEVVLYELISDHIDVAKGILHELCRRLRSIQY